MLHGELVPPVSSDVELVASVSLQQNIRQLLWPLAVFFGGNVANVRIPVGGGVVEGDDGRIVGVVWLHQLG